MLNKLRNMGLYYREHRNIPGKRGLYDVISDAPMATEFSISRFLTPILAEHGFALFMDCDVLIRQSLSDLFRIAEADETKAVWCVKHDYRPLAASKMFGQAQTRYARKNWSSVMVFNVDHPSNAKLTVSMINNLPGRDLHRFCWLADDEIGELEASWNWLVNWSPAEIDPKIVHYTEGTPDMPGHENDAYAQEWWDHLL